MGRVPAGNDIKMIKAGVSLARAKGLNGFTVRDVCTKSKVNLGMFHYYFTSKDNFDIAVLKTIYEQMLEKININISPQAPARDNVRAILVSINEFIKENRVLLSALAGDVFSGNKNTFKFIAENFTVHVSILAEQLKRAEKSGELAVPGIMDAILILMPPIALGQVVLGLLGRLNVSLPGKIKLAAASAMVDSGADKRINILINTVFKGK